MQSPTRSTDQPLSSAAPAAAVSGPSPRPTTRPKRPEDHRRQNVIRRREQATTQRIPMNPANMAIEPRDIAAEGLRRRHERISKLIPHELWLGVRTPGHRTLS